MSVIDIVVWIPCTTAMPPEEKKDYLVTVLDFRGTEKERRRVLIAEYSLLKIVDNKGEWAFTKNVANSSYIFTNVIAWASMPDPYYPSDEVKRIFGREDKECIE